MDKFLVTITQYAMSNELHGCYREAMLKLTHDQSPCYIAKGTHARACAIFHVLCDCLMTLHRHCTSPPPGWLMGGQREYLEKVSSLYEYILNQTLELGTLCVCGAFTLHSTPSGGGLPACGSPLFGKCTLSSPNACTHQDAWGRRRRC